MEVKAKAKYIRISPRKVRAVVNIIRGLEVEQAFDQLRFVKKQAVRPIEKLLFSAVANAENNFELEKNNLYIKEIKVNEGPTLHRWRPRARGRAAPIRKRTSHIDLVLAELIESGKTKAKKTKVEKPVKIKEKPKEEEGLKVKDKKEEEKKEPYALRKKEEKDKKIIDPRREGRGKHAKIEGAGRKGAVGKFFRRKSG